MSFKCVPPELVCMIIIFIADDSITHSISFYLALVPHLSLSLSVSLSPPEQS